METRCCSTSSSLVRSTSSGELQDAEFTASGDSADPTQGRPELLLGAQRGLRLGFEELGEGGDEGTSWTTSDPNTELRDTISVVSRSQYPLFSRTM